MKKIGIIMLVMSLLLSGCGSKTDPNATAKVKWEGDGTYKINGKDASMISLYQGYSATVDGLEITSENLTDLSLAARNNRGVEVVNMDEYRGNAWGWGEENGSIITLYYKAGDDYYYSAETLANGRTATEVYALLYSYLDAVTLTNGDVKVEFGDLTFASPYQETINVTPDYISITGLIRVTKAKNTQCTTPQNIPLTKGSIDVLMAATSDRNYYQYGDWLIESTPGINIGEYLSK